MPNRMIRDTIHTSESVNLMTDFDFRLWISLITYVDDYGRGDARPAVIKGNCFPLRDSVRVQDIQKSLLHLERIGCISLYDVAGKPFLCFPNWDKYQRIQTKKSRFPSPDDRNKSTVTHGDQPYSTVNHRKSPPEVEEEVEEETNSNPNQKVSAEAPTDRFDKAMADYAEMRKKIRAPLTDRARELTISELEKLAPGDTEMQILILDQSVQKGWRGVFPLKNCEKTAKTADKTDVHDDLDYLMSTVEGKQQ